MVWGAHWEQEGGKGDGSCHNLLGCALGRLVAGGGEGWGRGLMRGGLVGWWGWDLLAQVRKQVILTEDVGVRESPR